MDDKNSIIEKVQKKMPTDWAFSLAIKILVKVPMSHLKTPGLNSQLQLLTLPSC